MTYLREYIKSLRLRPDAPWPLPKYDPRRWLKLRLIKTPSTIPETPISHAGLQGEENGKL